jgi:hypothetical protein
MKVFDEIIKRAAQDPQDQELPDEINSRMIGDLATVGPTTPVGQSVANILLGTESGETSERGYIPPLLGSRRCKADKCKSIHTSSIL